MKKIFFIFIFSILTIITSNTSYGLGTCSTAGALDVDLNVEITGSANMRNLPCTEDSTIMDVSIIGDTYKVVAQVAPFYKVKIDEYTYYWIWEEALEIIDEDEISGDNSTDNDEENSENNSSNEVEITTNPEDSEYIFTNEDNAIIKAFSEKLSSVVEEDGDSILSKIEPKIELVLENNNLPERYISLFEEFQKIVTELSSDDEEIEEVEDDSEYNEGEDKEIVFGTKDSYKDDLEDYNIDFSRVKDYWFDLYDEERSDLGLYSYTYSSKLEETAFEWSNTQNEAGTAGHRRSTDDKYYDYDIITTWFADRDVVCENRSGVTHTENVGWGQFACTDGECSDELESAIGRTFDFFMDEKDEEYQPHYLSIVNKYFNYAGLGISVNEVSENYYEFYLTVHYCTEFD